LGRERAKKHKIKGGAPLKKIKKTGEEMKRKYPSRREKMGTR